MVLFVVVLFVVVSLLICEGFLHLGRLVVSRQSACSRAASAKRVGERARLPA